MQYLGGKSKNSKNIVEAITNEVFRWEKQNQQGNCTSSSELGGGQGNLIDSFVSLFCGSCAVESKIYAKHKLLNDNHEYLISMWQGAQEGYTFPDIITDEQYKYIKANKDEDKALTGFVGFGCSFGGKWFGGLARNKKGDNYCARANRSLYKDLKGLMDAEFTCLDYKDVTIPKGSVVYCDPPYANTTGYTTGKFDTKDFWEYIRLISKENMVFISEENAPDDFECIWQKEIKRMLDSNKGNIFVRTEKLWKYKGD